MYSARYGRIIVNIMDKIIDIFNANAKNASRNRISLMRKFAFITELVLKGGLLAYTLAGLFYLINPIYSYYYRNEIVTLVPLFLPFI